MRCAYAHHDGAYVLGALAPAERREYEQHLAACEPCAVAVRELAGLPGLLDRVAPQVLETPPVGPPPPSLLPALLADVRRTRRHRTGRWLAVAAAAVLVAAGGAAGAGVALHDTPRPATSAAVAAGLPMTPVAAAPVHATVAFEAVPWGTRLSLSCSYDDPGRYGSPSAPSYALVVRTRDGRTEQVATWHAVPGRTMRLTAATAADRAEIASVELRTADGHPVLRLAG